MARLASQVQLVNDRPAKHLAMTTSRSKEQQHDLVPSRGLGTQDATRLPSGRHGRGLLEQAPTPKPPGGTFSFQLILPTLLHFQNVDPGGRNMFQRIQ
jgi:hypothetical protein